MMRSDDPLERRLRQTPLREPASHWREQILSAAESVLVEAEATPRWRAWLRLIPNPRPVSWAAVAAIWSLAFIFHSQTSSPARAVAVAARKGPVTRIFQERQRMLANVFENDEPRVVPPPRKTQPGPQSRLQLNCIAV